MKELKIGETITIKCVEDNSRIPLCTKCCFFKACNALSVNCQSFRRTDGKNVHYEIVDEKCMVIAQAKEIEIPESVDESGAFVLAECKLTIIK